MIEEEEYPMLRELAQELEITNVLSLWCLYARVLVRAGEADLPVV